MKWQDKRRQYDYITALTQHSQQFVTETNFGVFFSQALDEDTLQQLLQRLATFGIGFGPGLDYIRGCRYGFGKRCRRWNQP
jgi:hypothetical protein